LAIVRWSELVVESESLLLESGLMVSTQAVSGVCIPLWSLLRGPLVGGAMGVARAFAICSLSCESC
jgi:hypothetical protein